MYSERKQRYGVNTPFRPSIVSLYSDFLESRLVKKQQGAKQPQWTHTTIKSGKASRLKERNVSCAAWCWKDTLTVRFSHLFLSPKTRLTNEKGIWGEYPIAALV